MTDPGTLLIVAVALAMIAAIAAIAPVRRAMRVDPVVARRYD